MVCFSYLVSDDYDIQTNQIGTIIESIGSEIKLSGKIEVYLMDGYPTADGSDSGPRILRIGVGLDISSGNDSINLFKTMCTTQLESKRY